ncbi:type VI secretion system ATPase TssH [Acanthopleuribacter pedis]|uniref:Type VI secretion system ATPase TssH n=1 Tax=Acanthopleuribacter pedis TaxID=442870 RepID=A0A8J7U585_9BACT|nr:type VI secretion system ATPase TssH [Acanthopleuribacter pedis]MBO1319056.1 type VI secretion system ATPase TssH [Acanthopleuribacter pedis]
MDASQIKALMGKLNKNMTKALESAAGTCIQRTHFEISVDHLLLKLLDQPKSDISILFTKQTINLDDARREIEDSLNLLKTGNHAKPKFSSILLESFAGAWNFANLERGEGKIRSSHMLIALLRDQNWIAGSRFRFLERLPEQQLVHQLNELTVGSEEVERRSPEAAEVAGNEALEAFTVNVVEQAKNGEVDPVIGRDAEIYQVVDILSRRRKNNPILVGEPGVGKSAIVEGLALLIAEGKAPPILENVQIRTLDLGILKAGASMKGEFEERVKSVIEAVQESSTPIILFIDEAHNLIGAGGQAGAGDAANLLKPALARGKLRTIAATTWSEYKKYIEKDAALERRFQVVKVDEPSADVATSMLRGLKDKYQEHHNVEVLDSAIEAAAQLADRYISGRQLPDKGIDLLDTACARVRMSLNSQPYELTQQENSIHMLKGEIEQKEKEEKLTGKSIEVLPELREKLAKSEASFNEFHERWEKEKAMVEAILEIDGQLIEARKEGKDDEDLHTQRNGKIRELEALQGDSPMVEFQVTPITVSQIVSQWTGIPVGKMVSDELANVLEIDKSLKKRVMGQDHAADRIASAIKSSKAKVNNPDTPIGCFLAVGPSGTGKTEMALTLADTLFGGERFVIQINMSEYQEKHTLSRLIGSPPGYVGYGEGGVLTEAVRQRPYSVVLLDEVEKGHPDVMNLFYQVFDKGHCADGEGRIIDFKNTIIIMTSNLGSNVIEEMCADDEWPDVNDLLESIRPHLNQFLKPALVARMTVIPYFPIGEKVMKKIVGLKLRKVAKRMMENHGVTVNVESDVIQGISDRCRLVEAGARNIDKIINAELLPLTAESILRQLMEEGELKKNLLVSMDDDNQFALGWS